MSVVGCPVWEVCHDRLRTNVEVTVAVMGGTGSARSFQPGPAWYEYGMSLSPTRQRACIGSAQRLWLAECSDRREGKKASGQHTDRETEDR